jgi:hypothetical protein
MTCVDRGLYKTQEHYQIIFYLKHRTLNTIKTNVIDSCHKSMSTSQKLGKDMLGLM